MIEEVQYLSIRYTERLIETNIEASVGVAPVTLMIMQWLKRLTVYIRQKSYDVAAHGATLMKWNLPHWNGLTGSNNRRLLEPIGNIPPA